MFSNLQLQNGGYLTKPSYLVVSIELQVDEIKETIEALNDCQDGNEEVNSNKSKDIESNPAYFILSHPLGHHKIEKVVFMRLQLSTSVFFI